MSGFPVNPEAMDVIRRSSERFYAACLTDGPARTGLQWPPLPEMPTPETPTFVRGYMSEGWIPGLDPLADAMDAAARRAEHRDPKSIRRLLRPARVTR